MKILITGANGYVGKSLYEAFKKQYEVTTLTRKEADLTNLEQLKSFFKDKYFDVIIHCAIKGGYRIAKDAPDVVDDNLKMYYNMLECKEHFNKFIHFGSGAERQDTFYGLSKKVIKESIQDKPNFYNIRIFAVFNENEAESRFVKTNIYNYINRKNIQIFSNKYMDFFYMDDLVLLVKYYIDNNKLPKEIDCSYNHLTTLYDVAEIINGLSDYKVNIKINNWEFDKPFNGKFTDLGLKFMGLEQGIINTYSKLKNEY